MNDARPGGVCRELLDRFGGGFDEGRAVRFFERLGEREEVSHPFRRTERHPNATLTREG
jgi:hypothetical protein